MNIHIIIQPGVPVNSETLSDAWNDDDDCFDIAAAEPVSVKQRDFAYTMSGETVTLTTLGIGLEAGRAAADIESQLRRLLAEKNIAADISIEPGKRGGADHRIQLKKCEETG